MVEMNIEANKKREEEVNQLENEIRRLKNRGIISGGVIDGESPENLHYRPGSG